MNAHGITRVTAHFRALGNHLAAANDEPEPLTDKQLLKGNPMAALLDSVLDAQRLKDILREEKAAGITPDENFLQRVDAAMLADKQTDGYGQRRLARGLERQVDANRRDPLLQGAY